MKMENLDFLSQEKAFEIRERFGTPAFIYSETLLQKYAAEVLAFPSAYGCTVRYAMKASSNRNLLKLFNSLGIKIDASSGFEVERAIHFGYQASDCSLSAQELPANFKELVNAGLNVNLCSLNQIVRYGELFPGTQVGLRFNPGIGTGHVKRTNVGGPSSSFGIWKDNVEQVKELVAKYNLDIHRIHTHIGSGTDTEIWLNAVSLSLDIVRHFPSAKTLNLGGGFKVQRVPEEKATDLSKLGHTIADSFRAFAKETGRELKLEIEPGSYFVVNACAVLSTIQDEVDTGKDGYHFLKLDTGMTEILRPFAYGSQHPMRVIFRGKEQRQVKKYIVVGHCCESGDILTPAPGDPEELKERELTEAKLGDLLLIGGAGGYCSSMATKNYNSFPEAPEVMLRSDGSLDLMRRRQELQQIFENELEIGF